MTDHQVISRAVIFLRARHRGSSGSNYQTEQRQLAAQRALCHQAADCLGLVVVREYVEHGGPSPISRRPQLRLLLEELRTLRDATCVITSQPDRLARTRTDRWAVQLELEAAGAQLIIASQLPAARTPEEVTV